MMITIDNMAQRYSLLPSEALSRATTFDLAVMDAAVRWQKIQRDKSEGRHTPTKALPTVEEMKALVKQVKERKK